MEAIDMPRVNYIWHGFPVHFVMLDQCRFHLTTSVGNNVVSTIGDCVLQDGTTIEIGSGHKYETMVFRITGHCPCGCGLPEIGDQIDSAGYNNPKDATAGHMKMCFEYAKPKHQK